MLNPFKKVSPQAVHDLQVHEAKVLALEHRAAAEHHLALATMYEQRLLRLLPGQAP